MRYGKTRIVKIDFRRSISTLLIKKIKTMGKSFENKYRMVLKWCNAFLFPLALGFIIFPFVPCGMVTPWALVLIVGLVIAGIGIHFGDIAFPIGTFAAACILSQYSGSSVAIGIITLLIAMIPNCIWFVPTGTVSVLLYFGKMREKSYEEGFAFRIPWISNTDDMDARIQTKTETDKKKVLTRNEIEIKYTLTFQIIPECAHIIYRKWGKDYYDTHIKKWVDAAFDGFVAKLTYPQFQTQKAKIEEIASALVRQVIDERCSEATKDMVERGYIPLPDGSTKKGDIPVTHMGFRCSWDKTGTEDFDIDGDGIPESIPTIDLKTWEVVADGINLFSIFILQINEVKFETSYEEARAKVAVAKAAVKEAEQRKKATITAAEGEAEAIREKAAAKAEEYEKQIAACRDPRAYAQLKLAEAIANHNGTLSIGGPSATLLSS